MSALATLALVGLGLGLGGAAANADPTFSIGGTISDTTGAGIGSLTLSLYDSTSALVDTQSTAADGSYTFAAVADGTYTVETTGPTGYVAIHAVATVADNNFVLNVTDPRYGKISGVLTAGGSPLSGVSIKAVDSATSAVYHADSVTDAGGAYSITVPATTGSYAISFTSSAGARLPISSYVLGGVLVTANDGCVLSAGGASIAGLAAGSPVSLTGALNPDPAACSGATPAPAASPVHHHSTQLAQTGTTLTATPTPTATDAPNATPESSASVTAPAVPKPVLTTTDSSRAMPPWGWLLVGAAVLAMLGGVGYTVLRHR